MFKAKGDKLTRAVHILTCIVSVTALYTFYDSFKKQGFLEQREKNYEERNKLTTKAYLEQLILSRKSFNLQVASDSNYRISDSLNRVFYIEDAKRNHHNLLKQEKKDSTIIEYYKSLSEKANFERNYILVNDRPAFNYFAHIDIDSTSTLHISATNIGKRPATNLSASLLLIDVDSMKYSEYNNYLINNLKLAVKVLYEKGNQELRFVFSPNYFERRKYIVFLINYMDYEFPGNAFYHASFFRTYPNLRQVDYCVDEKERKYIMDFVANKNIEEFNYNDLQIHL